ncbi:WD repeat-containing protein 1-A-like [Patiria miniata]|uniref:Uncharacterized protein n=1 Tax=Patiria miniata TaxID=46514 RepID=A0A914B5N2_PATMI|nr:WD repeat-containing protein 1-A-like [Patiria miniata]
MPFSYVRKSLFAAQPSTTRGSPFILGGDPKGKKFLYVNEKNVFIRDIENPAICDMYCVPGEFLTVAKYAPSGNYIASAGMSGKVMIWDITQGTMKYELQPVSYKINDIAWFNSEQIVVCGEGGDSTSKLVRWDGSAVSTLDHSGQHCNAVDCRNHRPFCAVIASDDISAAFYKGRSVNFTKHLSLNKYPRRGVKAIKFSPDGEYLATGGGNGHALLHTGQEGELVGELPDVDDFAAHRGPVYSVYFSPDSKRLLTASGDRTVKMWDVETRQLITTFNMGTAYVDQQVAVLWQEDYILSLSLRNDIYYLDRNNPDTPLRIIKGHSNIIIVAIVLSSDANTIYSAGDKLFKSSLCLFYSLDYSLTVTLYWDAESGECDVVAPGTETLLNVATGVTAMSTNGNTVASLMNGEIRFLNTETKTYTDERIELDNQAKCITAKGDLMVVGTVGDICMFKNKTKVDSKVIGYIANAAHLSPMDFLAVGGSDSKVHIFDVSRDTLTELHQLPASGNVGAVQFSSNGTRLACGDESGQILVWTVSRFGDRSILLQVVRNSWSGHDRILSLSWNPEGKRIATGDSTGDIGIWDVDNLQEGNLILEAHPFSPVTAVAWRDNTTVVSAGHDNCIKQWTV